MKNYGGIIVALVIMTMALMVTMGSNVDRVYAEDQEVSMDSEAWVEIKDNGDGTCKITKFRYKPQISPTRIVIPKMLKNDRGDDLIIKEIGAQAFVGAGLTSLRFDDESKITHIGKQAFMGNNISSLKLPDEIVQIGDEAFSTTQGIGKLDLSNCSKLTRIGDQAFYKAGITEVHFPDSLETIVRWAFAHNTIKKPIVIKSKTKTIGAGAFTGRKAVIDCSAHQPGSIQGAPWAAGVVSLDDNSRVIWNNKDYQSDYNNPGSRNPFYLDKTTGYIYGLKDDIAGASSNYRYFDKETGELTIPAEIDDVEVKGFAAFALANSSYETVSAIKKVTMDSGCNIETLSSSLCRGLGWLKEFVINDHVKTVSDLCFYMAGIVEIDLKKTERIGSNAFYSRFLEKVTIGSAISSIGSSAFPDLETFKRIDVDKPKDGVSGAPWGALYTKVYWNDGQVTEPFSLLTSNDGRWKFEPDTGTLHKFIQYEEGMVLEVPSSVVAGTKSYDIKTIGFSRYNILGDPSTPCRFSKVIIPEGIEEIHRAFFNINVDSVDLSQAKDLKKITGYAFSNSRLTDIVIPESVEELGVSAFANNDFIGQIELSQNLKTIETNTFEGCSGITSFKVNQRYNESTTSEYPYATESLRTRSYGAPNVSNSVFFADEARPIPTHTVEPVPGTNQIRINYEIGTNMDTDIAKDIVPKENMPSVEITHRPTSDGTQNKLTGHMLIDSHSQAVQGGNGTYTVTIKFGYSGSTDFSTMDYPVKIDGFHKIRYDANPPISSLSGAVPLDNGAYVNGYERPVAGAGSLSVPGYRFIGWAETPDGDKKYDAGQTMIMPDHDVVLYAKWEEIHTDVILHANGGSFENGEETKTITGRFDQLLSQTSGYEVPVKDNDQFIGWARSQYAEIPDVTKVPESNHTYYAVWGSGSVTLTFDANGGDIDGSGSSSLFGYPGTYVVFPDAKRKGYEHNGWSYDKEGTRPVSSTTVPNRDMTYYAKWDPLSNTVTFPDSEGGRSTTDDVTVASGNPINVTPTAEADDDYLFTDRWLCSEGGIFTSDEVSKYIITGKNDVVSFTPQFVGKGSALIIYDFNGGVYEDAGLKIYTGIAGENFIGQLPEPVKDGYSYEWNRERPSKFPGEGENILVKARWTPAENRVEFKAGTGGSTTTEARMIPSGDPVGIEPVATASEGYIFTGLWECSEGGSFSPEQIKNYIISGKNELVTFTARFQAKTRTLVKFVVPAGGELLTEPEINVDNGHLVGITPEVKVNTGYKFDNTWKCSEGGTFTTDELKKYRVSGGIEEITFTANLTKAESNNDTESPWTGKDEDEIDKLITGRSTEEPAGATFGMLRAKGVPKGKTAVTLKWTRLSKAAKYVVYANKCGKKNKYKKIKTLKSTAKSFKIKRLLGKKIKKNTYYKMVVVAFDKNGKALAVSKTVHVATKGGKKGNDKSVKLKKPTKSKLTLKLKKTHKIKAKEVKTKNKKTHRHRKIAYESTNRKVAKVSKKGVITATGKGKCTIYVYAQNGVYKTIKVTVK